MKNQIIIAGVFVLSLFVIAGANAIDDAKVYYDKGLIVEVPSSDFDIKLNALIISSFTYESNDGAKDKSNFEVNQARLSLRGNVLNKQFSFLINGDFIGDSEDEETSGKDSNLKDAWIQWNNSQTNKWRIGQWSTPFSRQQPINDVLIMFPKDSIATSEFALGRNTGFGMFGEVNEVAYFANVFNGKSEEEGENRRGKDTKLQGIVGVSYAANGFDRAVEPDVENTENLSWTVGSQIAYEEAEFETIDENMFRLGIDVGFKVRGLSISSEIFYRNTDVDQENDSVNDLGYYLQGGYFVIPKEIEIAARFSAITFDEKEEGQEEDRYEYSLFLNKYFMGNNLKVLTGVTFLDDKLKGEDSTLDTRYQFYVMGFF